MWIASTQRGEKFLDRNVGITQCAFERVAIHLGVIREDNAAAIAMLHLHVTSLPMALFETESLQSG